MRSQSLYLATGVNKFSNLQKPKPCKTKFEPIAPCTREFSRALSKLQMIARNSDWFMALFVLAVIGQSDYFGFGFSTVLQPREYGNPLITLGITSLSEPLKMSTGSELLF